MGLNGASYAGVSAGATAAGAAASSSAASERGPAEKRRAVPFDPRLFVDPRIPADTPDAMVRAVREHLRRYGNHQSPKNTLARLEDDRWLAAWDPALRAMSGRDVVFWGSELGVFALRASTYGARRIVVLEPNPLERRITAGIVRKNQLLSWHAKYGEQMASASSAEKEASFEALTRTIEVVGEPDTADLSTLESPVLVLPNLDHSLLGTGAAAAAGRCRERGLAADAQILPARATVHAMGLQWRYAQTPFDLRPMNRFRWSPYPDTQDLPPAAWLPLTDVTQIGEIDFGRCADAVWSTDVQVHTSGTLDAIMYWFELDLGGSILSNTPDSGLRCLRPAIQYADSSHVQAGGSVPVKLHVSKTRLRFEPTPEPTEVRTGMLASWYMPMIHDGHRNAAYEAALNGVAKRKRLDSVIDIGSGCGLLSMLAAKTGAGEVYGCEVSEAVCQAAHDVLDLNGWRGAVKVLQKDCRQVRVPRDLPRRADAAVFEMFDCSLIGEGVLHFLAHAREHLLQPDASLVPMSGHIRAALIEYRLDTLWGFDVNLLNPYRFAPGFINVDADDMAYRQLTEPFDVFAFDFATATPKPAEAILEPAATAAGVAGAVLFWFDLSLQEDVRLSNEPHARAKCHWKQGLQFLPEARVERLQRLPLTASHDGSSLTFRWTQDGLPRESFVQLPRYDPVAWHDVTRLESRTQEMLQRCSADTPEYQRLADLAIRFAIDPAAHGLEPRVAQRFADWFLRAP